MQNDVCEEFDTRNLFEFSLPANKRENSSVLIQNLRPHIEATCGLV